MICDSMPFYFLFFETQKTTFQTKKQTKSEWKICENNIKMFETQKMY